MATINTMHIRGKVVNPKFVFIFFDLHMNMLVTYYFVS